MSQYHADVRGGAWIGCHHKLDECIALGKQHLKHNPKDVIIISKSLGRLYVLDNEDHIRGDGEVTHYSEKPKEDKTHER